MIMKEVILTLCSGIVLGGIFSLLKLPIPAPQTIAGIMGVVGIFLGYFIVKLLIK